MGELGFNDLTGEYIFKGSFEERHYPKSAGFRFFEESSLWSTTEVKKANQLRHFVATTELNSQILRLTGQFEETDTSCNPGTPDLTGKHFWPSKSGKKIFPFQIQGVHWILTHKNSYLADDMGLGKTTQAIWAVKLAWAHTNSAQKTLIVCPPFAINNWIAELKDWGDSDPRILILESGSFDTIVDLRLVDWVIVPDSILSKIGKKLESLNFDWALIDEAHRFKEKKSGRTHALLGGFLAQRTHSENKEGYRKKGYFSKGALWNCKRIVMMSGTPMPNRPIEMWPVLNRLCPEAIDFMNEHQYARRYCAAYRLEIKRWNAPPIYRWDYSGASNLDELHDRLKKYFMLRRLKTEVIKDLPEKTRQIIEINTKASTRKVLRFEQKELKKINLSAILNDPSSLTSNLAEARRLIGTEMAEQASDYIDNILDENRDKKLIVYAWHTDVIDKLAENLFHFDPLIIDGRIDRHKKHEVEKLFNADKKRRLMIGQIEACGIALNFQVANIGIFVEGSYVFTQNEQAEDRMLRIGQKNAVHIQYLTFKDSLYNFVLQKNFTKRLITKKAIG